MDQLPESCPEQGHCVSPSDGPLGQVSHCDGCSTRHLALKDVARLLQEHEARLDLWTEQQQRHHSALLEQLKDELLSGVADHLRGFRMSLEEELPSRRWNTGVQFPQQTQAAIPELEEVTPVPVTASASTSSGENAEHKKVFATAQATRRYHPGSVSDVALSSKASRLKSVTSEAMFVNSCESSGNALQLVQLKRLLDKEDVAFNRKKLRGAFKEAIRGKWIVLPSGLKHQLSKAVDSYVFQQFCAFMIVANTVYFGIETDQSMHAALRNDNVPAAFSYINQGFAFWFCLEVVLRICAKRLDFFFSPEWKWNLFDLTLAVCSLAEEVLMNIQVSFFRILRVFRVVRVLRAIRALRFFHELRLMVYSVISSLASLIWAFVLLCLIIYLFSIFFMQAAANHIQDGYGHSDMKVDTGDLTKWYGSMATTMFSLCLSISGGVDWHEPVMPLHDISVVYTLIFVLYVVFVVFGVLNVLTAVFVESSSKLASIDRDVVIHAELSRSKAQMADMLDLFRNVDAQEKGYLTETEFLDFLTNRRVKAYFSSLHLDSSDANRLFRLLDTDGTGILSVDKFVFGCMRLQGQAKSVDMAEALYQCRRLNHVVTQVVEILSDHFASFENDMASGSRTPAAQQEMDAPDRSGVMTL